MTDMVTCPHCLNHVKVGPDDDRRRIDCPFCAKIFAEGDEPEPTSRNRYLAIGLGVAAAAAIGAAVTYLVADDEPQPPDDRSFIQPEYGVIMEPIDRKPRRSPPRSYVDDEPGDAFGAPPKGGPDSKKSIEDQIHDP